jgi:hypothetical protein
MLQLQWLFADHPLWVGLIVALACIFVAAAAYRPMRLLLTKFTKSKN